jgi:hypothetical protein
MANEATGDVSEATEDVVGDVVKVDDIAGRPEYIPEKYWDEAAGRARVEEMGKGYIELASTLGKRDETTRAEITKELTDAQLEGVPDQAAAYKYVPGEGVLPEGTEFKVDVDNPQYKAFGEWALKNKLNHEQYSEVINLYVENELAMMPDKVAETQKLGENGAARIERVDLWAKANLTESSYKAIVGQATSGEFIIAMEELIKKSTVGADVEGAGDAVSQGPLNREELETMMKDPRYRETMKRDPAFVKRVQDGFAALG